MIYKHKETREVEVLDKKECDRCNKSVTYDEHTWEWLEFHHIRFIGGYGSVFGDGDCIECDLCQDCLKELIGEFYRVEEVEDEGIN